MVFSFNIAVLLFMVECTNVAIGLNFAVKRGCTSHLDRKQSRVHLP